VTVVTGTASVLEGEELPWPTRGAAQHICDDHHSAPWRSLLPYQCTVPGSAVHSWNLGPLWWAALFFSWSALPQTAKPSAVRSQRLCLRPPSSP